MNKYKSLITISIIVILISIVISYRAVYQLGKQHGITVALDTVNKILVNQIKSDTTVSGLILELPKQDTVIYYLSDKTIK